jgi:hypothetical protein
LVVGHILQVHAGQGTSFVGDPVGSLDEPSVELGAEDLDNLVLPVAEALDHYDEDTLG